MFKHLMASIGFGAAKLKLDLPKTEFRQGEEISGTVFVEGGKVRQKVEQLYLHLDVTSQYEYNDKMQSFNASLDTHTNHSSFEIDGEDFRKEITFSYHVPVNIPITLGRTRYEMVAGLDIKNAINPDDHINVKILPCIEAEAVLLAFQDLGFKHTYDSGNYNGKIQWFEFKPTDFMRSKLDELEAAFRINPDNIVLIMDIDRKGQGLSGLLMEALDANEKHVTYKISRNQLIKGGTPDIESAKSILCDFLNRQ